MEKRAVYNATRLGPILAAQGRRQDWLARSAGISESYLSHALKGRMNFTVETAQRIADVLGVPLFLAFDLTGVNEAPKSREDVEEAV